MGLSFARNAKDDANVGSETPFSLACNFTKNGVLSPLFFKDFANILGTIFLSNNSEWLLLYLHLLVFGPFLQRFEMIFLLWFEIISYTEAATDR